MWLPSPIVDPNPLFLEYRLWQPHSVSPKRSRGDTEYARDTKYGVIPPFPPLSPDPRITPGGHPGTVRWLYGLDIPMVLQDHHSVWDSHFRNTFIGNYFSYDCL